MIKNKAKIKRLILVVIIGFLTIFAAHYSNINKKQIIQTTKSEIEADSSTLIVGVSVTEPFVYYDENEQLTGYDIQLIQLIAEKLDKEIKFIEMPFANLIPAVENNNIDIAIAAIHITPERQQRVTFSTPYLDTGLVMVVDPLKTQISKIADIQGKQVGVKIGATGFDYAQKFLAEGLDFKVIEYKNTKDSFLDLGVGRLDVIFNDYVNSKYLLLDTFSNLKIAEDQNNNIIFINKVGLGIAVNKNNPILVDQINQALKQIDINHIMPFDTEH